jgi:Domain of unknown function (DUF4266)
MSILLRVLLIVGVASVSGCANVQPFERGHLAAPEMQFDADPGAVRLAQHLFNSKEAASGGYSAGGGGCGCN